VAELLARHRDRIAGRVPFVFQPADEPMSGARRMIDDGLLDRARPDLSMSVHVLPMLKVGRVVVQRGSDLGELGQPDAGHRRARASDRHADPVRRRARCRAGDDRAPRPGRSGRSVGGAGELPGAAAHGEQPGGGDPSRPPSFLGTAKPDKGITEAWHRSGFDIDEDALPVGVHVMATAALGLLR
jgi:metal-dependent amidase/aminoacylase/carboxypeptidase family protein